MVGRCPLLSSLGRERFQETARLAERACFSVACSSDRDGNSSVLRHRAPESDHPGCDVHPRNIVEGRRQESEKEFARFLRIALNSGFELEYHLIVARDVGVMAESDSASLVAEVIEVRKMIYGLLNKIGNRDPCPTDAEMEAPSKTAPKL
jgi:23S rRNA-intervening sequence protein